MDRQIMYMKMVKKNIWKMVFVNNTKLISSNAIGNWLLLLCTSGPVTTRMGHCLLTGKPSQYVPNNICQFSLPSLRGK